MSTARSGGVRAVFDTNVYISAFIYPAGLPFRIWRQAVEGRFVLLVSPAIMRETAKVLRRFQWQEDEIVRYLKLVAKVAEIVVPTIAVDAVFEDETDNRILECAVAGHAGLVVSGDRHLLRLKSFEGIGIVRPVDFRRVLQA
jgi:putative PIN family toxin of toxin-antitoxin system